jgi:hypothetical protein
MKERACNTISNAASKEKRAGRHPREQAIDGGPYTLRGITGSSALKGYGLSI